MAGLLDRKELERQRRQIRAAANKLQKQIKEAEQSENWELYEELDKRLDILKRKQKRILHRLGLYRYDEHEIVEYAPGELIKASIYYWLMDD